MVNYRYGLLVVAISGLILSGCAKKEVVKTEEPLVPAVTSAPETPAPLPPQPQPPPPPPPPPLPAPLPPPVKVEAVPEKVMMPEAMQKAVPSESVQNMMLEMIHFDFDKSDLREPDREILTRNAGILMDKLKVKVQIEGHCDERGSTEYNLALGERRAKSAMKYLIALGVPSDMLSIISYGEEKPLDEGHNEESWAKNRRAQFVIKDE